MAPGSASGADKLSLREMKFRALVSKGYASSVSPSNAMARAAPNEQFRSKRPPKSWGEHRVASDVQRGSAREIDLRCDKERHDLGVYAHDRQCLGNGQAASWKDLGDRSAPLRGPEVVRFLKAKAAALESGKE
jgi:hypothetical protein